MLQRDLIQQEQGQEGQAAVIRSQNPKQERQAPVEGQDLHD
jgi:hypothetical protein